MKVARGWIWRALLLTSLVATAIRAQDEQSDVQVSDADELSLNEEEEEEEEVTLVDKDEAGVSGKDGGDENVSFQVSDGQYLRLKFKSCTRRCFHKRNVVVGECGYRWEPGWM